MTESDPLHVGQRIVVRTPDRHEYWGELMEIRTRVGEKEVAVVRLDTGWLTSYPITMVHSAEKPLHGV